MIRPDPGIPIEKQTEPALLRMLMWGEARGDGPLGMTAVAWVAHNRLGKWGASLREVILAKWQFSCFNANDPNRPKLVVAPVEGRDAYVQADACASLMEAGIVTDPTRGATHYCTENVWNVVPEPDGPKWNDSGEIMAGRTKFLAHIGHHFFATAA